MYTDKDSNGKISVMEMTPAEAKDLNTILSEMEYYIGKSLLINRNDAARMAMFAAKLRFNISNSLNDKGYDIGDIVLYKNTRGNLRFVKITSFTTMPNGRIWLNGFDTKTNAIVSYPVYLSKIYMKKTTNQNQ